MSVTIIQPAETPVTVEYNSAAELAEKMLEILDQRGWCRGDLKNGDGNVCLVGAAGLAYGRDAWFGYELNPLARPAVAGLIDGVVKYRHHINPDSPALTGSGVMPLWRFNDVYADGVEDVKAALRYAIDRESREPASV